MRIIISDQHKFVFVHIPKCAGTSVRRLLDRFDSTGGRFSPHVKVHETFGRLDYTHLPMPVLRSAFPTEFEKVRKYQTFALVRDPRDRFLSALAQHLKMYGARELAQLDKNEIDRFAKETITKLSNPKNEFLPEYIHFMPQEKFISLEGEVLVDNMYPVSRVNALVAQIGAVVGEHLGSVGTENRTLIFRNDSLRRIALRGKQIGERVLPEQIVKPINRAARQLMMKSVRAGDQRTRLGAEIDDFVIQFYSRDFEIYLMAQRAADDELIMKDL